MVEGHFGVLGTGFNPDMSQHLLAADRLADGTGSQLLEQGYPLGPHSIVVALDKGLGIGLVQGFDGLTTAVVVLAALTGLSAFADQPFLRRSAGALVVGLPYLVASYYAQGSFKETMQALFLLAFVLALREASRNPEWRRLPLRFVPAAIVAIGSVYAYSFPGLIWLAGAALLWGIAEWAQTRFASPSTGPASRNAVSLALIVFAVGALPELGRMIDFHSFETFDPNGPGLGNLFGQVSPFTAFGIWPSGDFRLAPGDGAVPAFAYYLGAAFATCLLLYGCYLCLRRREAALLSGGLAAAAVYLAARAGGTPYTAAKALEIAAPILTLIIVTPLLGESRAGRPMRHVREIGAPRMASAMFASAVVYLLAAGGCSLLAFANAPVGPTSYSPALTGLRPLIAADSTLALAPSRPARRRTGRPLRRLGAARRPRLHLCRGRSGRGPASGSAFRHHLGAVGSPAVSGFDAAPRRRSLSALGTRDGRLRTEPLPADRRPPGPPGPRAVTRFLSLGPKPGARTQFLPDSGKNCVRDRRGRRPDVRG